MNLTVPAATAGRKADGVRGAAGGRDASRAFILDNIARGGKAPQTSQPRAASFGATKALSRPIQPRPTPTGAVL